MRGGVATRQLHAAGRRARGVQVLCLTRNASGKQRPTSRCNEKCLCLPHEGGAPFRAGSRLARTAGRASRAPRRPRFVVSSFNIKLLLCTTSQTMPASRSESHFYDEGIVTYDVEETMGDAWMLPPKATSRDWWVRDPDTLNLWDWAPWSFSMGFYANIGALFWATATLSVAALAVGWCGCLRFCAPEHEAKPNAVPTVVSESKDAP